MSPSSPSLPAVVPTTVAPQISRDLGHRVARVLMAAAWSARHPREPFAQDTPKTGSQPVYYAAADGWEAPLHRFAPGPGAPGHPVILAHGLGVNGLSFDFCGGISLARTLRSAGFDVFVLSHRGDPDAVAPRDARPFDFDDIVAHDLPAAIARVRDLTGSRRILWVGHALGGQLLYAHLARGGADDLSGAITLCAAARFPVPRSRARVVAIAAQMVPASWRLPSRAVAQALAPSGGHRLCASVARTVAGPALRSLMVEGVVDIQGGMVRQMGRWLAAGTLCDRTDQVDYIAALGGLRIPLLGVACRGDQVCPPDSAYPAVAELDREQTDWWELGPAWGHLDPLISPRATQEVFPRLTTWLSRWAPRCWA